MFKITGNHKKYKPPLRFPQILRMHINKNNCPQKEEKE
jgi:hypothetical protein